MTRPLRHAGPRPRSSAASRLLGFGPVGWSASGVLVAMLWAIAAGIDLRYELLRLTCATLGPDAMFALLMHVITPIALAEWGGRASAFGPIAMGATLVALHIHPRPAGAIRIATVVLAGLGMPFLTWYGLRLAGHVLGYNDFNAIYAASTVNMLAINALTALLLRWWTGSWRVALWFLPWLVLVPVVHLAAFDLPAGWWPEFATTNAEPVLSIIMYSFNPVLAVILLVWAVRGRLRPAAAGRCASCGYDLAGLANERCPECGAPFNPAATEAATASTLDPS